MVTTDRRTTLSLAGAVLLLSGNVIAAANHDARQVSTTTTSLAVANDLKSSACSYNYQALVSNKPTSTPQVILDAFTSTGNGRLGAQPTTILDYYCSSAWGRVASATFTPGPWQSWQASIAPQATRQASICADVPELEAEFLLLAVSDADSCQTALQKAFVVAQSWNVPGAETVSTTVLTGTVVPSTSTQTREATETSTGADETAAEGGEEEDDSEPTSSTMTAGAMQAMETGRVTVAVLAAMGGVMGAMGMM
ncbi:hypothetical protein QBC35DRAFT_172647 [Podospora australis]|uniref:Infection structure specific protein n=1 Tax=Podospora australis TaxID=1536484 RepID=A0AAN7ABD4_9PEZI|nr:hypothetical protein QBC35DRAFT_172647 [Podospora australis]